MALHQLLKKSVNQRRDGDDLLLFDQVGHCLRFASPSGLLMQMLQRLATTGGTLLELMDGFSSLAPFLTLQQLEQRGWINLALMTTQGPLLTLEPQTIALERRHPPLGLVQIQWSHFLQITPQMEGIRLEVPLQGSRLLLQDRGLTSLLWDLSVPKDWDSVARALPENIQDQNQDLLMLLLSAGVAGVVEADGVLSCDRRQEKQRWSREDLNLHHRSRNGWHHQTIGASFPGAELEPAPPLLHQGGFLDALELPQLAPDEPDPGFFHVLERRCSRRLASPGVLTLHQLGRLLWAALRIREAHPAKQGMVKSYEWASRPVACGGGMQEIDAYLLVRRCEGIASGLYRYNPLHHQLLRIDDLNASCTQLLKNACRSSLADQQPDVLFIFAARYGRLSWKYEGLPYAMILKHVGVIMQQLYLVATALDLAPCGLGSGDSELFARATQLDPFSNVPVGEFMLSGSFQLYLKPMS